MYNIYKARINANGNTRNQRMTNDGIKSFLYMLENGYQNSISIDGIDYSCIIEDKSSTRESNKDEKSLYCKFIDDIKIGDFFFYKSLNWLIIQQDIKTIDSYKKFFIHKCNQKYKWLSEKGIMEYPCVAKMPSSISSGVNESDKGANIQNYPYAIVVQSNDDTNSTKENMRFIFGRNVYKIAKIEDSITEGLLYIYFNVDQKRDEDDFSSGIADNNHSYKLEIQSSTIKNTIGYSTTITANVYDNNTIVTTDVTWTSSNPSVFTVDSNGVINLIGHGSAVLIATYGNLRDEISIQVGDTQQNSIDIAMSPIVDKVTQFDDDKQFQFVKYSNGNISSTQNLTITYSDDFDGSGYTYSLLPNNNVKIKNNDVDDGYVTIKVSDDVSSFEKEFKIRLVAW